MKLKILTATLLFSLVLNQVVSAEISLNPIGTNRSNFFVKAEVGETKSFVVEAVNTGKEKSTATIYTSQYMTATNGGPNFIDPGEEIQGTGLWIGKRLDEVELEPNQTKRLEYTVKIPKETLDGQYTIGIVALNRNVANIDTTMEINGQDTRVSGPANLKLPVQIVLEVGNKRIHQLDIQDFSYNYESSGIPKLNTTLINKGTILEKPKTTIEVFDSNNRRVEKVSHKNTASFYMDSSQLTYVKSDKVLDAGNYRAKVTAEYFGKTITKEFNFEVKKEDVERSLAALESNKLDVSEVNTGIKPIYIYICGVLLLFFIILLFWKRRKKDSPPQIMEGNIQ